MKRMIVWFMFMSSVLVRAELDSHEGTNFNAINNKEIHRKHNFVKRNNTRQLHSLLETIKSLPQNVIQSRLQNLALHHVTSSKLTAQLISQISDDLIDNILMLVQQQLGSGDLTAAAGSYFEAGLTADSNTEAAGHFSNAGDTSTDAGDYDTAATAYSFAGIVLLADENYSGAIEQLEKAVTSVNTELMVSEKSKEEEVNLEIFAAENSLLIALIHEESGDQATADMAYQTALASYDAVITDITSFSTEIEDNIEQILLIDAHIAKFNILFALEDYNSAAAELEIVIQLGKDRGDYLLSQNQSVLAADVYTEVINVYIVLRALHANIIEDTTAADNVNTSLIALGETTKTLYENAGDLEKANNVESLIAPFRRSLSLIEPIRKVTFRLLDTLSDIGQGVSNFGRTLKKVGVESLGALGVSDVNRIDLSREIKNTDFLKTPRAEFITQVPNYGSASVPFNNENARQDNQADLQKKLRQLADKALNYFNNLNYSSLQSVINVDNVFNRTVIDQNFSRLASLFFSDLLSVQGTYRMLQTYKLDNESNTADIRNFKEFRGRLVRLHSRAHERAAPGQSRNVDKIIDIIKTLREGLSNVRSGSLQSYLFAARDFGTAMEQFEKDLVTAFVIAHQAILLDLAWSNPTTTEQGKLNAAGYGQGNVATWRNDALNKLNTIASTYQEYGREFQAILIRDFILRHFGSSLTVSRKTTEYNTMMSLFDTWINKQSSRFNKLVAQLSKVAISFREGITNLSASYVAFGALEARNIGVAGFTDTITTEQAYFMAGFLYQYANLYTGVVDSFSRSAQQHSTSTNAVNMYVNAAKVQEFLITSLDLNAVGALFHGAGFISEGASRTAFYITAGDKYLRGLNYTGARTEYEAANSALGTFESSGKLSLQRQVYEKLALLYDGPSVTDVDEAGKNYKLLGDTRQALARSTTNSVNKLSQYGFAQTAYETAVARYTTAGMTYEDELGAVYKELGETHKNIGDLSTGATQTTAYNNAVTNFVNAATSYIAAGTDFKDDAGVSYQRAGDVYQINLSDRANAGAQRKLAGDMFKLHGDESSLSTEDRLAAYSTAVTLYTSSVADYTDVGTGSESNLGLVHQKLAELHLARAALLTGTDQTSAYNSAAVSYVNSAVKYNEAGQRNIAGQNYHLSGDIYINNLSNSASAAQQYRNAAGMYKLHGDDSSITGTSQTTAYTSAAENYLLASQRYLDDESYSLAGLMYNLRGDIYKDNLMQAANAGAAYKLAGDNYHLDILNNTDALTLAAMNYDLSGGQYTVAGSGYEDEAGSSYKLAGDMYVLEVANVMESAKLALYNSAKTSYGNSAGRYDAAGAGYEDEAGLSYKLLGDTHKFVAVLSTGTDQTTAYTNGALQYTTSGLRYNSAANTFKKEAGQSYALAGNCYETVMDNANAAISYTASGDAYKLAGDVAVMMADKGTHYTAAHLNYGRSTVLYGSDLLNNLVQESRHYKLQGDMKKLIGDNSTGTGQTAAYTDAISLYLNAGTGYDVAATGYEDEAADSYDIRGDVYTLLGDYGNAAAEHVKAGMRYPSETHKQQKADSYNKAGDAYKLQGDGLSGVSQVTAYTNAAENYVIAAPIYQALGNRNIEGDNYALGANRYAVVGNTANAGLHYKNAGDAYTAYSVTPNTFVHNTTHYPTAINYYSLSVQNYTAAGDDANKNASYDLHGDVSVLLADVYEVAGDSESDETTALAHYANAVIYYQTAAVSYANSSNTSKRISTTTKLALVNIKSATTATSDATQAATSYTAAAQAYADIANLITGAEQIAAYENAGDYYTLAATKYSDAGNKAAEGAQYRFAGDYYRRAADLSTIDMTKQTELYTDAVNRYASSAVAYDGAGNSYFDEAANSYSVTADVFVILNNLSSAYTNYTTAGQRYSSATSVFENRALVGELRELAGNAYRRAAEVSTGTDQSSAYINAATVFKSAGSWHVQHVLNYPGRATDLDGGRLYTLAGDIYGLINDFANQINAYNGQGVTSAIYIYDRIIAEKQSEMVIPPETDGDAANNISRQNHIDQVNGLIAGIHVKIGEAQYNQNSQMPIDSSGASYRTAADMYAALGNHALAVSNYVLSAERFGANHAQAARSHSLAGGSYVQLGDTLNAVTQYKLSKDKYELVSDTVSAVTELQNLNPQLTALSGQAASLKSQADAEFSVVGVAAYVNSDSTSVLVDAVAKYMESGALYETIAGVYEALLDEATNNGIVNDAASAIAAYNNGIIAYDDDNPSISVVSAIDVYNGLQDTANVNLVNNKVAGLYEKVGNLHKDRLLPTATTDTQRQGFYLNMAVAYNTAAGRYNILATPNRTKAATLYHEAADAYVAEGDLYADPMKLNDATEANNSYKDAADNYDLSGDIYRDYIEVSPYTLTSQVVINYNNAIMYYTVAGQTALQDAVTAKLTALPGLADIPIGENSTSYNTAEASTPSDAVGYRTQAGQYLSAVNEFTLDRNKALAHKKAAGAFGGAYSTSASARDLEEQADNFYLAAELYASLAFTSDASANHVAAAEAYVELSLLQSQLSVTVPAMMTIHDIVPSAYNPISDAANSTYKAARSYQKAAEQVGNDVHRARAGRYYEAADNYAQILFESTLTAPFAETSSNYNDAEDDNPTDAAGYRAQAAKYVLAVSDFVRPDNKALAYKKAYIAYDQAYRLQGDNSQNDLTNRDAQNTAGSALSDIRKQNNWRSAENYRRATNGDDATAFANYSLAGDRYMEYALDVTPASPTTSAFNIYVTAAYFDAYNKGYDQATSQNTGQTNTAKAVVIEKAALARSKEAESWIRGIAKEIATAANRYKLSGDTYTQAAMLRAANSTEQQAAYEKSGIEYAKAGDLLNPSQNGVFTNVDNETLTIVGDADAAIVNYNLAINAFDAAVAAGSQTSGALKTTVQNKINELQGPLGDANNHFNDAESHFKAGEYAEAGTDYLLAAEDYLTAGALEQEALSYKKAGDSFAQFTDISNIQQAADSYYKAATKYYTKANSDNNALSNPTAQETDALLELWRNGAESYTLSIDTHQQLVDFATLTDTQLIEVYKNLSSSYLYRGVIGELPTTSGRFTTSGNRLFYEEYFNQFVPIYETRYATALNYYQALVKANAVTNYTEFDSVVSDLDIVSGYFDLHTRAATFGVSQELQSKYDIRDVAFNPVDTVVATVNSKNEIKVYQINESSSWAAFPTLTGHAGQVTSLSWSSDGTKLVSGSLDTADNIKVWHKPSTSWVLDRSLTHTGNGVNAVAWSSDGTKIASGSADTSSNIKLWETTNWTNSHTTTHGTVGVNTLAWNGDSSLLASGSADTSDTIKIWSGVDLAAVQTLSDGHNAPVNAVAWNHDDTLLASASVDETVKVWNVGAWTVAQTLDAHTEVIHDVIFNSSGTLLATASGDKTVKVWNTSTWDVSRTLTGHFGDVFSVSFSPSDNYLMSSSCDNDVVVWNTSTWTTVFTSISSLTNFAVTAVATHILNNKVVVGSSDGNITVWDANTWTRNAVFQGHGGNAITSLTLNEAGTILLSTSEGATDNIKVWQEIDTYNWFLEDTKTHDNNMGVTAGTSGADAPAVYSGAYHHSSGTFATVANGSTGNVKIWSLTGGASLTLTLSQTLTHPNTYRVYSAAWNNGSGSPTLFVTGGLSDMANQTEIAIWNPADWTANPVTLAHGGQEQVQAVAISPDNTTIATGESAGDIKIWTKPASTWTLNQTLTGHTGAILSLAFSPDGSKLASGSADNTAKIWSTATWGAAVGTLSGNVSDVNALAWVVERNASSQLLPSAYLWTGLANNTALLWYADQETRLAQAYDLQGDIFNVLATRDEVAAPAETEAESGYDWFSVGRGYHDAGRKYALAKTQHTANASTVSNINTQTLEELAATSACNAASTAFSKASTAYNKITVANSDQNTFDFVAEPDAMRPSGYAESTKLDDLYLDQQALGSCS